MERSDSGEPGRIPDSTWRLCMVVVPVSIIAALLAWSFVAALFADDESAPVGVPLWLIVLSPFATLVASIVAAARDPARPSQRLQLVVFSTATSIAFAAVGLVLWLASAEIACGDAYECPF